MLKTLHVSNLGVLGDVEVDFPAGLSCLTGETGAGKSLLVDAIELLLGARADAGVVRQGQREAVIEALVDVTGLPGARAAFEDAGYPVDDGEVRLRRIVGADGRGKAWIQGRLATSRELRDLGGALVSVAGQHAFIGLSVARERLAMLDAFAGTAADVLAYAGRWAAYRDARDDLARLQARQADREARADYLRYVVDSIETLGPVAGEIESLAAEAQVLRGAERLREMAAAVTDALYEGAPSACDGLARALQSAREMARIDDRAVAFASRLELLQIEARDVSREVESYVGSVDLDPARLAHVDDRLDALKGLARKHGGSLESVLDTLAAARAELAELAGTDEQAGRLEAVASGLRAEVDAFAAALSAKRRAAAVAMSTQVTDSVRGLAMAGATLEVRVDAADAGETGTDRVDFQVETNPGEGWGPVTDVASGGELSRITLALYSVLSASVGTPVMVYDEIDAGVSGAVAERMAEALGRAANHRQILVVTHHGQVAARAAAHFLVDKATSDGRTLASIRRLEGDDRLAEIARIIGGQTITEAVLRHATEMLGPASKGPVQRGLL